MSYQNEKKVYNKKLDKVEVQPFTDYKTYSFDKGQTPVVNIGQTIKPNDKIAEGKFTNHVFYKTIGRLLLVALFLFISFMVYRAFIKRRKEGRVHS